MKNEVTRLPDGTVVVVTVIPPQCKESPEFRCHDNVEGERRRRESLRTQRINDLNDERGELRELLGCPDDGDLVEVGRTAVDELERLRDERTRIVLAIGGIRQEGLVNHIVANEYERHGLQHLVSEVKLALQTPKNDELLEHATRIMTELNDLRSDLTAIRKYLGLPQNADRLEIEAELISRSQQLADLRDAEEKRELEKIKRRNRKAQPRSGTQSR